MPQYIIGEGGEAEEGLQDGIHIASVAKVGKSKVIGRMGEERKKTTHEAFLDIVQQESLSFLSLLKVSVFCIASNIPNM